MPQSMEIENIVSDDTGNNPTEDDLTDMMVANLVISPTKEIHKIDTSNCLPNAAKHSGLYKSRFTELRVDTSLSSESFSEQPPTPPIQNKGVPGFPEFPDYWCGEEGWATWQRIPPTRKTHVAQRRQRAEDIQNAHRSMVLRRLQRQAVNVAGMPPRRNNPRNKAGYRPATKTKAHKMERRRKLVQQLRNRREIVALQKSMKALNCN